MNDLQPKVHKGSQVTRWLWLCAAALLLVEVILLPFMLRSIYTKEVPRTDRVISYDRGSLRFGNGCEFDDRGVMRLELFDTYYGGDSSSDGEKLILPGQNGRDMVQLQNKVKGSVKYTAVAYVIKDSDMIPVEAELIGSSYDDTETYSLPEGVAKEQVLRAVTGELAYEEVVNFNLLWRWDFSGGENQDEIDTAIGSLEGDGNVVIGLYVTVEDDNIYLTPLKPDNKMLAYVSVMLVSGAALGVLTAFYIKGKKKHA